MTTKRVFPILSIILAAMAGCRSGTGPESVKELNVETITAKRLCIVDDDGRPRISLGMETWGAVVCILDDKGSTRISVGAGSGGESGEDSSALVQVFSEDGKTAVFTGLIHTYPVMQMYYQGGDARLSLGVDGPSEGAPFVSLGTDDGVSHLMLTVDPEGAPSIRLYDAEQKRHDEAEGIIWSAP